MIISLNQRKVKFEPRIKFNHNIVILATVLPPLKSLSHLSSSNMNFVYPLSFSNFTNKLNLQACRRQLLIAMHIFNDHSQIKLAVLFSPACSTPSATSAFKKTHRISQPRVGRKQGDEGFQAWLKSLLDSLACYSLIEQKNSEVFRYQSEAITAATVWNWSVKNCPRDLFRPCLKTFVARFVRNRLTAPGSLRMSRECYSVHQSGFFSHENAGNGRIAFDGVGPGKFYIFYRAYWFENVGRKQKRFMSLEH